MKWLATSKTPPISMMRSDGYVCAYLFTDTFNERHVYGLYDLNDNIIEYIYQPSSSTVRLDTSFLDSLLPPYDPSVIIESSHKRCKQPELLEPSEVLERCRLAVHLLPGRFTDGYISDFPPESSLSKTSSIFHISESTHMSLLNHVITSIITTLYNNRNYLCSSGHIEYANKYDLSIERSMGLPSIILTYVTINTPIQLKDIAHHLRKHTTSNYHTPNHDDYPLTSHPYILRQITPTSKNLSDIVDAFTKALEDNVKNMDELPEKDRWFTFYMEREYNKGSPEITLHFYKPI